MYLLERLFFHIKKGSLFTALFNLFIQFFKSQNDLPIGNTYHGKKALIYDDHRQNDIYWKACLLYTSPSPRDKRQSRMPSSA